MSTGASSGRPNTDDPPGAIEGRLPDFFIVGQPKTGSTALHAMLRSHPEIYMPALKEPNYFASELRGYPSPADLPETLDEYLALFAPSVNYELAGEASILYLWSSAAAREISHAQPNARIIVIFREPVSFLQSLHLQFLKTRVETEPCLRKALALEEPRRNGRELPVTGLWPPLLQYSEHMAYTAQLQRYQEAFPSSQLLVLIYDDFRAANRLVLEQILQFLEVDSRMSLEPIEVNRSVGPQAGRARELIDALSQGRGRGFRVVKAGIHAVTTQRMRQHAHRAARQKAVNRKPARLEPKLELELRHRFRPEVEALGDHIGRNLTSLWHYDQLA